MRLFLAVAGGGKFPPRFIVMRYRGGEDRLTIADAITYCVKGKNSLDFTPYNTAPVRSIARSIYRSYRQRGLHESLAE